MNFKNLILRICFSVSPLEAYITTKNISVDVLRGLMLVCKLMQSIANGVPFSKEQYMVPFNDFVRSQFEKARRLVIEEHIG